MKVIALVIVGTIFGFSCNAQVKQIVFVCEHGSAKSVIAAAYFNELAKEKNLPYEAIARGTNPDKEISVKTKQLLIQDDLFDKSFVPQKLSQQDVDGAQQVFLFYTLPEAIQSKDNIQYWLEIDAVNGDFIKLKNDIVSKLIPLIDSLSKQ
jgi:arsenate reductase (thioredoxin)